MAEGGDDALHAGDFSYLNYIDFTPSVAASDGDLQVFTASFWVKPDTLADLAMFSASPFEGATSPRFNFWTNSNGVLRFHFNFTGSSWQYFQSGNNVLVANEWQHIHIQFDSRESDNSDRLKIFRNSKRIALPTFGTVPFNLPQGCVGNNVPHGIGVNIYRPTDTNKQFDGQIACFNLCIGNIYNVESFCTIDTENEVMTPILEPTVVYGENGFRVTQAKRIEKDLSGNANNFTKRGSPLSVEVPEEEPISAVVLNQLYDFSSFTFTAGNTFGPNGPSLSTLKTAYNTSINPWVDNLAYFNVSNGQQLWTVPATANYRITALGGSGGIHGGSYYPAFPGAGALVSGVFSLPQGLILTLIVGQKPSSTTSSGGNGAGGGGGTFVFTYDNDFPYALLLVAGGGGGTGHGGGSGRGGNGKGGSATTNSVESSFGETFGINARFGAGSSGNKGTGQGGNASVGGDYNGGGGGTGWITSGNSYPGRGGGGSLSAGGGSEDGVAMSGGFGGGGGAGGSGNAAGGGGGYTGGGAGRGWQDVYGANSWGGGGGGGSYVASQASNVSMTAGQSGISYSDTRNGYILIEIV